MATPATLPLWLKTLCTVESWWTKPRTALSIFSSYATYIGSLAYFLSRLTSTSTATFRGSYFLRDDIFKQQEYLWVAVIFASFQLAEMLDVGLLLRKTKRASPNIIRVVDLLTYINEGVYWGIMIAYAAKFQNDDDCIQDSGIFTCSNDKLSYFGRWDKLWIAALVKLVVDVFLFVLFRILQARNNAVSHGQTVGRLLFGVQNLLIALFLNEKIMKQNKQQLISDKMLYSPVLLFLVAYCFVWFAPAAVIFNIYCMVQEFRVARAVKHPAPSSAVRPPTENQEPPSTTSTLLVTDRRWYLWTRRVSHVLSSVTWVSALVSMLYIAGVAGHVFPQRTVSDCIVWLVALISSLSLYALCSFVVRLSVGSDTLLVDFSREPNVYPLVLHLAGHACKAPELESSPQRTGEPASSD